MQQIRVSAMLFMMRNASHSFGAVLALAGLLAIPPIAGCASAEDWRTDGRYWRQPTEKPPPRPVSIRTGRDGDTAQYGSAGGTMRCAEGVERGGGDYARAGRTMDSAVLPESTASYGERETPTHSSAYPEESSSYSSYRESSSDVGEYSETSKVSRWHDTR